MAFTMLTLNGGSAWRISEDSFINTLALDNS